MRAERKHTIAMLDLIELIGIIFVGLAIVFCSNESFIVNDLGLPEWVGTLFGSFRGLLLGMGLVIIAIYLGKPRTDLVRGKSRPWRGGEKI